MIIIYLLRYNISVLNEIKLQLLHSATYSRGDFTKRKRVEYFPSARFHVSSAVNDN